MFYVISENELTMNKDEINAQIDRRLASENISITDRLDIVRNELFPDINSNEDDYPDVDALLGRVSPDRLLNYLFEVDNWYKENYGDKIYPVSLNIKETQFFFKVKFGTLHTQRKLTTILMLLNLQFSQK